MIAIIDYKAGNLTSVQRALSHIGIPSVITDNPEDIFSSEKVIFPGVGAAGSAMEVIKTQRLDRVIHEVIGNGTPFLGICLGAQVILDTSEEDDTSCLGIIPGIARKFPITRLKIPHTGWNSLRMTRSHPVFHDVDPRDQFYFVHSYYPETRRDEHIIAYTDYGIEFASVIGNGNVIATQFHLEKSGVSGLKILENFCTWNGRIDD